MTQTHRTVAFGVSLAVVAPIPAPWYVQLPLVGLGTHAGAWPDYDTKGSTPSREFGPLSKFLSWVVRILICLPVQVATRDGDNARKDNGVHRRFTHTVEACLIAGLLVWYVADWLPLTSPWSAWFGLVSFVGAFSHVVLGDIFTPHGVPLCLTLNLLRGRPWHRYRIPIGVTTDHPSEHLVFMLAVRVSVMLAAVMALQLPATPHTFAAAGVLAAGWHWAVLTGLSRKVTR
jgi:membrane-bound metal-dependent hydrolase YbcI (DUF457 family)